MTDFIAAARERLRSARRVVAFSGAGVSAESGISTYRSGADGLWSAQHFEKYANPRGYHAHLPDSYRWYRDRARTVAAAQPNAAHLALAALESRVPAVQVVTQNVDGLHLRAGSTQVIELHGHLRDAFCESCGDRVPWAEAPEAPRCVCGGTMRPAVVMFDEMLPENALSAARDAAESCDVLLTIGTSAQVWPAAELPLIARDAGACVVVVNPDLAGQPDGRNVIRLAGRAAEIVPQLTAW